MLRLIRRICSRPHISAWHVGGCKLSWVHAAALVVFDVYILCIQLMCWDRLRIDDDALYDATSSKGKE
jgi:hypothetical protein